MNVWICTYEYFCIHIYFYPYVYILKPWINHLHIYFYPCVYILKPWNARLDEALAGIKIARRNINNLRYADDTTLTAESEEELKRLLKKVKEESEKTGLKLNIYKIKFMVSGPIMSWQIDGETMETERDFSFLISKITADGDCSHEIKRCLLLGRKDTTNIDRVFAQQRKLQARWKDSPQVGRK